MKQVFRFTPQELRPAGATRTGSSPTAASSSGCRTGRRSPGTRCSRSSRRARSPASSTSTSNAARTAARSWSTAHPAVIEVTNDDDTADAALLLRAHLSDCRRPRAPRRAGAPAVRPRRRPRRRRRASRARSAAAPARARRTAACGCRAPSTRSSSASARSSASRSRSAARPRLAGRSSSATAPRCPGSSALGLDALFPDRGRRSPAPRSTTSGSRPPAPTRSGRSRPPPIPLDGSPRPRRAGAGALRAPGHRRVDRAVHRHARRGRARRVPGRRTWACAARSAAPAPTSLAAASGFGRGGRTRRCTCGARRAGHRHVRVRPHDLYLPWSRPFFSLRTRCGIRYC